MERAYKTMTSAGAMNIAFGIVVLVVGFAAGIISIINGARLIAHRKELTF